ncbi:MAG: hypothetical protein QW735_02265 [archaeon]
MRGSDATVQCVFCGTRIPRSKAIPFIKYSFNYIDERVGLEYRGVPERKFCCKSCARHRGIKDMRQSKSKKF